jgi:hypothetical protein
MVRKIVMTLALGIFAATGAVASAADKCTITKETDDNPVAKACKKGGIPEAKKAMKAMVAKAKKSGMQVDCEKCHRDSGADNYALTADAEKLFKEMMAKQ